MRRRYYLEDLALDEAWRRFELALVRADGLLRIPRFSEGVHAGAEVTVELLRDPAEMRGRSSRSAATTWRWMGIPAARSAAPGPG